jgi:pimeloyl-ACP methyl ester carboxylesterase
VILVGHSFGGLTIPLVPALRQLDPEGTLSRGRNRRFPVAPCPLNELPDLPTSYVVCRDDRMASNEWGRRTAQARLGTDPVEIDGGHCPFLSRPRELANLLVGLL